MCKGEKTVRETAPEPSRLEVAARMVTAVQLRSERGYRLSTSTLTKAAVEMADRLIDSASDTPAIESLERQFSEKLAQQGDEHHEYVRTINAEHVAQIELIVKQHEDAIITLKAAHIAAMDTQSLAGGPLHCACGKPYSSRAADCYRGLQGVMNPGEVSNLRRTAMDARDAMCARNEARGIEHGSDLALVKLSDALAALDYCRDDD